MVSGKPGSYTLMRGGKPFFVKGGGGVGFAESLAKHGANAARSWGLETAKQDLEACRKNGLVLQMGIWLPHKNENRDYADPKVIEELKGRVRDAVRIGKDHPSLLAYGLGNEMEWGRDADPAVWKGVGELAKLLKSLDPNHPIVTVVAELPEGKVDAIKRYAPDVDILGVNSYGGAPSVPDRLKKMGWTKPYLLTEFGPLGPWEGGKSPWGAAYEATSTEKAARYAESYRKGVLGAPGWCLGSFAFLWGSKQEETSTWFGMLLPETNEPVESAETMSALWRGVAVPAGRIASFSLDRTEVEAGSTVYATYTPKGNRPAKLTVLVRGETPVKSNMGQGEATRPVISTTEVANVGSARAISVSAPKEPGAYRVYVVARDGSGYAATANVPFRVK